MSPIVQVIDVVATKSLPPPHKIYSLTHPNPPSFPLEPVQIYFSRDEEVLVALRPPLWAKPKINVDEISYYLPPAVHNPNPAPVSNREIQKVMLNPKRVPTYLLNLQMVNPLAKRFELIPAHVPDLSDLERIERPEKEGPVLSQIRENMRIDLEGEFSTSVLPPELAHLADPVVILNPLREISLMTYNYISLMLESWTNKVKLVRIAMKWEHVFVTALWEEKLRDVSRLASVQWSCHDSILYSPMEGEILDITLEQNSEAREELMRLPSIPRFMTMLAWNVRGLARPSFRSNFMHLIKVHNPDMVVLTELRVAARNCEKILKELPFDSSMIVDA